jgi:glycosyltransferase involved in cell wall biosynthesis
MLISIVIPAYNAAGHIEKALHSIFAGFDAASGWALEVIVVDDGSVDSEALARVCAPFQAARLLRHNRNRGMCAARNTGFHDSQGDFVTLLDSDDEFVADWFSGFRAILAEWPAEVNVCFTPCINDAGKRTCMRPDYKGWLTAEDMVLEHLSGEYNPIFRGDYIRRGGYADLGTRKSCGLLTYLRMAREAPFWITDKVQRLYHDAVEQSVTRGWTRPEKAAETYYCFSTVLEEHGAFIRGVSEGKYRQMYYKALVYRMLARQGRNFGGWWRAFSSRSLKSWLATLVLLLIGPSGSVYLLNAAKRFSVLRKYG